MLGAGDIKLMAVCMGILGFSDGLTVIFIGFALAFLHALMKAKKNGVFRGQKLRLAPYLFMGYCAYLII